MRVIKYYAWEKSWRRRNAAVGAGREQRGHALDVGHLRSARAPSSACDASFSTPVFIQIALGSYSLAGNTLTSSTA